MLTFAPISSQRRGRYMIASAAVALLTLTGCNGGSTNDSASTAPVIPTASSESVVPTNTSMKPSPSAGASSPTDSAAPESGGTTLVKAGQTALAQVSGSTLISIETERNGAAWEVQLVTSDGTEQELELSADGTQVVAGPVTKNEDVADKTKHLDRVNAAKLDYAQAAQKMLSAVPNGTITELNLDSEQGTTVWEADVMDESNVKHSVQIDAASGEVLSNSPN